MSASPFLRGESVRKKRKVIVITFGGGARDQETFAPEGQENIPHMLSELAPQSSFFTHVTNHGILGHYVATASLATGVYETLNNFSAVAPEHPTVFEYFRKDLKRPVLRRMGRRTEQRLQPYRRKRVPFLWTRARARASFCQSICSALPPRRRTAQTSTICSATTTKPRSTRHNSAAGKFELQQLEGILRLSVADFMAHARTLSSPDELSVYIAKRLMQQEAPSLLVDHDARHRCGPLRRIFALHRRHSPYRSPLRGIVEGSSERARIRRQHDHSSSFPISAATLTTTPAATDSSIIARATPPAAPPG